MNININNKINNNFKQSINWSTNRRNWGYNPWWNRPAHYPWYGGSWNCGWRRPPIYYPPRWPGYWTGPRPGEVVAWGLIGWGLGNLIFDSGYSSYSNPYPVQPIPVSTGDTITYNQPITVVAAETATTASESPEVADEAVTQSELHMEGALSSFASGDYLAALEGVNKAISESPGDGAFHEFRALVLFALGQYGEAAGVLNPLLASAPGWDWSTMIQLYGSPDTYTEQLRKLEEHAVANPESASTQFLLGYHYMICTYLDQAAEAFSKASELEPADRVSAQMAELAAASTTSGDEVESGEVAEGDAEPTEPVATEPQVAVELETLLGSWKSDNGENGIVSLTLSEDGTFTWRFEGEGRDPFEMKGDFNLGQANILTLDASDSQMAGTVSVSPEGAMNFVLAGGPPGDPGLQFEKG